VPPSRNPGGDSAISRFDTNARLVALPPFLRWPGQIAERRKARASVSLAMRDAPQPARTSTFPPAPAAFRRVKSWSRSRPFGLAPATPRRSRDRQPIWSDLRQENHSKRCRKLQHRGSRSMTKVTTGARPRSDMIAEVIDACRTIARHPGPFTSEMSAVHSDPDRQICAARWAIWTVDAPTCVPISRMRRV